MFAKKLTKNAQIYIIPVLRPKNIYSKPCFDTAYLEKRCKNLLLKKEPNMSPFWGNFLFSKHTLRTLKSNPILKKWFNLVAWRGFHITKPTF
jgi:hypothetical protein